MSKYTLIFILSSLFFAGCLPNHEEEEKWSRWETEIVPLSAKELHFIDSLERIGLKTRIEHYYVGRYYSPEYQVTIEMDTSIIVFENCNKVKTSLKSILNDLYQNVIADSVIYDTKHFRIAISNEPVLKDSLCNDQWGYMSFTKDELENWNGFKVEKIKGKDQYIRKYK